MDDKTWVLATVSVTTAVVGALWANGGRAAWQRRMMREELQIAESLPTGPAQRAMRRVAEDRAMRYFSTWLGPKPMTWKTHLIVGAIVIGGLSAVGGLAEAVDRLDEGFLDGLALLGLIVLVITVPLWMVTWLFLTIQSERAVNLRSQQKAARERTLQALQKRPEDI